MPEYTEGVMSDGAVVLRDGEPVPISGVVQMLNSAAAARFRPARDYHLGVLVMVVEAARFYESEGGLFVGVREDVDLEASAPGLLRALSPILSAIESGADRSFRKDDLVQHHGV